jgi:hypothetical protein
MPRRGARAGTVCLVLSLLLIGACSQPSQTATPPRVDPGAQNAGNPKNAAYTPGAGLVADSTFRPKDHGLPFENYGRVLADGSGPIDMTADDERAMFGDGVCADAKSGKCDLTPEAQAWLDSTNREMAAGHCYGFSVAAELLWQHKLDPSKFGAVTTPALEIEDNPTLQRRIAYLWATQLLDSVRSHAVVGSPTEVLDKLRDALKPNPSETYTVVIFKPDGNGGHAVTPYAVEDKGSGKFNVLIYDNNWPSVPGRSASTPTTTPGPTTRPPTPRSTARSTPATPRRRRSLFFRRHRASVRSRAPSVASARTQRRRGEPASSPRRRPRRSTSTAATPTTPTC